MKKVYLVLTLIILAVIFQSKSYGQLLLHESFSYTLPATIGGNGAAGTSANNWMTHSVTSGQTTTDTLYPGSLNYPGLEASTGGHLHLFSYNNTISRDVNSALPTNTNTVMYYSALISIVDNSQLPTTADYFMHFGASSGASITLFGGRLGAKSVNTGANYRLSIENNSGGTPTFTDFAQDLNFGITYLVVVKYDRSTTPTTAYLWVNPDATSFGGAEPSGSVSNNSGTATSFTTFASICLRNNATTPKIDIDEIRVGSTWADVTPPASVSTPALTAAPTSLTGFLYIVGSGPSTSQSYNLSGTALTGAPGNITVTAPADYEVSLDNTTFTATIDVPYASATLSATPVYARLKSGLAVAAYNTEIITNAGGGATTINDTCSGGVIDIPSPTLTAAPTSLTGFSYIVGSGPSTSQSYNLSGTALTGAPGNITVTAPADYEVSLDNTTFTATVDVPYASATLSATPVYTRLISGLAIAAYNSEDITNAGGGATTINVTCSGDVIDIPSPTLTATPISLTGFSYIVGSGPSTSQSYNLSGTALTGAPGNITVTAPTDYEVSLDNTTFTATVDVPYTSATLSATPVYARLISGLAIAAYNSEDITIAGGGATTINVTCNGDVNAVPVPPAIVITEIMYNPPESGTDSLEFIEFYNNGSTAVGLKNYTLTVGTGIYTFKDDTVQPTGYYLITVDSVKFTKFYGKIGHKWNFGGLSNSGKLLLLKDNLGAFADSVHYMPTAPWPTDANGNGSSLTLCDPNLDNGLASSWQASAEMVSPDSVNHKIVRATPGTGCITTGISVINETNTTLNCFPNPVKNILTVALNGFVNDITMFDILGNIVFEKKNVSSSIQINTSEFNTGIYLIKVTYPNNTIGTRKISVN